MNNLCKLLILSFLCASCTPNATKTIKNDNLYVIDLDELGEYTKVNASSIFKNMKTIILETNKDCLIGSDFKFSAFDNYFFILNTLFSKDFLMFDKEGKFIRKIGGLGRGPGEYTRVFNFTIDTVHRVIYLLCDMVINKYQMDGTYIGAIRLEYYQPHQIQYAHGKLYIESDRGKYMLLEIDPETGKQTGEYLEAARHNKGWIEESFTYQEGPLKRSWVESPKFVHTFMDTVFAIRPDGLVPFLAIKSKHLTDNADVEATKGMDPQKRINAIENKDKIFCINHYFDTKKHIVFRYMHGKGSSTVLFDRLANTCQSAFLFNDFAFIESYRMMTQEIVFSDANGIYEAVYGHNKEFLFEEYIEKDKLNPHVDKWDELMKLNEESNPVIFYYSYDDAE